MYFGITHINLDAKARLALPTRYRGLLEQNCDNQVCVTADPIARCLLIYPQPEWEQLARKLMRMPSMDPRARKTGRILMGLAEQRQVDGQGRVLLSQGQREYVGIDKAVVLMGQGNKFEIWGKETFDEDIKQWPNADEYGDPNDMPDYMINW